jgi:hypothetical protein
MGLFELGDFTLHSGDKSNFKIECDYLTDGDWECLAKMLLERLPRFRDVEGIPNGGLMLEHFLFPYATGESKDPILIVDDVHTTGLSFNDHIKDREGEFIGAVVFARGIVHQEWIMPLFQLALPTMANWKIRPKLVQTKDKKYLRMEE